MRRTGTFVHEVRVMLAPGADPAAVGGAITEALCGGWDHDEPCRWPHHTSVSQDGGITVTRTVFLARRREQDEVRRRIDVRLSVGELTGPDGTVSRWQHMHSRAVPAQPAEVGSLRPSSQSRTA